MNSIFMASSFEVAGIQPNRRRALLTDTDVHRAGGGNSIVEAPVDRLEHGTRSITRAAPPHPTRAACNHLNPSRRIEIGYRQTVSPQSGFDLAWSPGELEKENLATRFGTASLLALLAIPMVLGASGCGGAEPKQPVDLGNGITVEVDQGLAGKELVLEIVRAEQAQLDFAPAAEACLLKRLEAVPESEYH